MPSQHQVIRLSSEKYWEDIKSEYLNRIANLSSNDVYPSPNPGPTTDDGGVNFECHCVSHLVASPCGYDFRKAISCQKASTEVEMQQGACGKELMSFMECVMRTKCFKEHDDRKN